MSTERDLLRDYARESATVLIYETHEIPNTNDVIVGTRGELAGKTFVATQNVLELIEKAESMGVKRVDVSGLRDAIRKGLT